MTNGTPPRRPPPPLPPPVPRLDQVRPIEERFAPPPGHNPANAVKRLNVDALLLAALREQAQAMRVDWKVVLQADAADHGSRHWINLQRLVQRAVPALRAALLNSPSPILLVCAGLLARYELMNLVTELEEHAGRPGHTPSAWMLLPTSHQGLPLIDGVAVPLVNNTRALALTQAWVENTHRASQATLSDVSVKHIQ